MSVFVAKLHFKGFSTLKRVTNLLDYFDL